jgi:hypothetical protein
MGTLPPPVIIFVDHPADIEIRDGIACCSIRSGEFVIEVRCTKHTLRASVDHANEAFAEEDARQSAQIVKLSERGPLFLVERND